MKSVRIPMVSSDGVADGAWAIAHQAYNRFNPNGKNKSVDSFIENAVLRYLIPSMHRQNTNKEHREIKKKNVLEILQSNMSSKNDGYVMGVRERDFVEQLQLRHEREKKQ